MTKMVLLGAIMAAVVVLCTVMWQGAFTCHGEGTGIRIGWVVKSHGC